MSFRWPSPALSPWCWPLSLFLSPISPASSWWPAFCSPAKWFGSSRSALRQPTPAQPVCLQAIAGRLEPWLLDTRSFCPAFLHAPTIGLRRAKLARTPTGQSPHFNSKAATALPRAHSRSARTTSDTSVSSRSGSRPVPYPVGQSGRWVSLKSGSIELAETPYFGNFASVHAKPWVCPSRTSPGSLPTFE
jgi:hypothetical protein